MRRTHMLGKQGLTRREFLKGASVAAGAVGVPFVLPSSVWAAPPSDRIAAAVVGVGGRGRYVLGAFMGSKGVQVVSVCDVDRGHLDSALKSAKGKFADVKGHTDFREIIARDDIDIVGIGTPDHWHAPVAIAAAKSGKDVFVEKPMMLTIKEGRAMVDAVRRYGRILQVGNQRRSSGDIRRMCELVRNGRIGKLLRAEVGLPGNNRKSPMVWSEQPVPDGFDYDMWLGPAPWAPYVKERCHYQFRFILDYSGGQMTNWGCHWLDVAQWGIGADDTGPVEIDGRGEFPKTGLFTTALRHDITYTYANGVKITCRSGGGGCKFVGTDGWISSSSRGEPRSMLKSEIGPNEINLHRAVGGHMGSFIHAVRTREDPSSPVESGHRTASLAHLGNISMLLGRKLRWDPVKEEFPGDDEANRMTWRPYRPPWNLSV